MGVSDHLTQIPCPNCHVNLFRATSADGCEMAFCEVCGAGGDFKQIVEHSAGLIPGLIRRDQIEEFMRKIRPGS